MPAATTLRTRKTTRKTRTTTARSGVNTAGSKKRREKNPGTDEWSMVIPAGDPYFWLCIELYELLTRKRGYYGCKESPLENALGVEEDGIEAWRYQAARIGEKCRRLRGELMDTGIRDTLMDIAGHGLVGIACLDHRKAQGTTDEPQDSAVAARS